MRTPKQPSTSSARYTSRSKASFCHDESGSSAFSIACSIASSSPPAANAKTNACRSADTSTRTRASAQSKSGIGAGEDVKRRAWTLLLRVAPETAEALSRLGVERLLPQELRRRRHHLLAHELDHSGKLRMKLLEACRRCVELRQSGVRHFE